MEVRVRFPQGTFPESYLGDRIRGARKALEGGGHVYLVPVRDREEGDLLVASLNANPGVTAGILHDWKGERSK